MTEEITNFINGPWWHLVTSVIATASILANITPDKTDNALVKVMDAFVQALALNFRQKGGK